MNTVRARENPILASALELLAAGISFVPIDHTTKRPLAWMLPQGEDGKSSWKPYQERLPTEEEVHRWFGPAKAIAVVGGQVSSGLEILDFDVPGFYERWCEAVGALANCLPVQQTGSGNHQVMLRTASPDGNLKLAYFPDDTAKSGRVIAIETRGEGGYAIIPPSLHPSGNHYTWLSRPDGFLDVPVLPTSQRDLLFDAARKLCQAPKTRQQIEREKEENKPVLVQRQSDQDRDTDSPIDIFNRDNHILDILSRWGYKSTARGERCCRPGGKSPSVIINRQSNTSYHNSANDELNYICEARGVVTPFDAHCLFEYRLDPTRDADLKDAVKRLARELGLTKPAKMHSGRSSKPQQPSSSSSSEPEQPEEWTPDQEIEVYIHEKNIFLFGPRCSHLTTKKEHGEEKDISIPMGQNVWPCEMFHRLETDEFGYRFRYLDPHGEERYGTIDSGSCTDDNPAKKACIELAKSGVNIEPRSKGLMAIAMGYWAKQTRPPIITLVSTCGWHGRDVYVNGDTIYGAPGWQVDERSPAIANRRGRNGSLEGWKEGVRQHITTKGLQLALATSLAGALIKPLNLLPFAIHLCVDSTRGKSTAAKVAAAVWGDPDQTLQTWNMTAKSPEGLAEQMDGACLTLDELALFDGEPKALSQTLHALCASRGRSAMDKNRDMGEQRSWRCTILSTGEVGTQARLGEMYQGGHRVRWLDVHCSPDRDLTKSKHHAEDISAWCHEHYGHASDAWISYLTTPGTIDKIREDFTSWRRYAEKYTGAVPEDGRIGDQLAILAVTLGHASVAQLLPYTKQDIDELLKWSISAVLDGGEGVEEQEPNQRRRTNTPADRAYELLLTQWLTQPYRFPEVGTVRAEVARDVIGYRVSGQPGTGSGEMWTTESLLNTCGILRDAGVDKTRRWINWCIKEGVAERRHEALTGLTSINAHQRWVVFTPRVG